MGRERRPPGKTPSPTAKQAKAALVSKGFLPDTRAGGGGEPGLLELLGRVGETLRKAQDELRKCEGSITRSPNQKLGDKAGEYAQWADDLAARLRTMEAER
jgi:hypothetical protein